MGEGTLNEALSHPREIFKPVITFSAFTFVLSGGRSYVQCAGELPVAEGFYRASLTLLLHITRRAFLQYQAHRDTDQIWSIGRGRFGDGAARFWELSKLRCIRAEAREL